MATKPQSKTAIDNIAAAVKNDIDITLPSGVNIKEGEMYPATGTWRLHLIVASGAEAEIVGTAIVNNLNTQARSFDIERLRRTTDGFKQVNIRTLTGNYTLAWEI